ncbi:DUF4145 domain-containing protein [bacterium]|nr:DUF4145 domain-containing protein [bacterium]MBU1982830.1 DUF4145 domain-containing protein [bacterium]
MTRRPKGQAAESPAEELEQLALRAIDTAKKAKKHRQSLTSHGFYANKLAELRADAVNVFRDLTTHSAGDVSAMAELIEKVFSPHGDVRKRADAQRELVFALRTAPTAPSQSTDKTLDGALFPQSLLAETKRGYVITIGRQMNGCFAAGWYDACAVMMRRLLECAIIESFEQLKLSATIRDTNGNYLQLSDLVNAALNERQLTLSRNAKKHLPELRDVGHLSAHGRHFTAQKDDIERVRLGCRIVIEEFLRHATLL